jgi:hypothetical protein
VPEGFSAIASPPPEPIEHGHQVKVTLGNVEVPVYAQRQGYLANRLGSTFKGFVDSGEDISTENFAVWLGDSVFDVLATLIPALPKRMSKHEFMGFDTAAAMESGDYDEAQDRSPTFPETVKAFEMIWKVNRFDLLGKLGTLVDPTLLRAIVRQQLTQRLLTTSMSSPSPSGDADLTSSGPRTPTSSPSGD